MDIKTYQKEQLDRVEGALGVAQGKAQRRGIAELFEGVATQPWAAPSVPSAL